MSQPNWNLKTTELCGRIAMLSELHKWGDIQDLLNEFALYAYKHGMTEASQIADYCDDGQVQHNPVIAILHARDNKTTL